MTAAAAAPVEVLHRDADFLVVAKPAGLVTTRPDPGPSLYESARALDPAAPRLHPSSRLDLEVTGVVTFARTRRATEHLLQARGAQRYERTYLGLCERAPSPPAGQWSAAIGLDPRDKRRRRALDTDTDTNTDAKAAGSREASTRYRACPQSGAAAAALWLWPLTGRTHQLRVHAAHAGVALLGDRKYGGAARLTLPDGQVVRAPRVMLHCARVAFPALDGEGMLEFVAPVPEDLQTLWRALGGDPALFATPPPPPGD